MNETVLAYRASKSTWAKALLHIQNLFILRCRAEIIILLSPKLMKVKHRMHFSKEIKQFKVITKVLK